MTSALIWGVWFLMTITIFGVFETVALREPNAPEDTLSANIRKLLRSFPELRWSSLAAFLGFITWFTIHIWLHGW